MLITLARKPLNGGGNVVSTCLQFGCGALNIDQTRIGSDPLWDTKPSVRYKASSMGTMGGHQTRPWVQDALSTGKPVKTTIPSKLGRFPANVLLVPTPEVLDVFPDTGSAKVRVEKNLGRKDETEWRIKPVPGVLKDFGDTGSAARYFKQIKGD